MGENEIRPAEGEGARRRQAVRQKLRQIIARKAGLKRMVREKGMEIANLRGRIVNATRDMFDLMRLKDEQIERLREQLAEQSSNYSGNTTSTERTSPQSRENRLIIPRNNQLKDPYVYATDTDKDLTKG